MPVKIAFNEADNTVFCFTCRKVFKEKKNKTSKADPAFVSSSFLASRLSNLLQFTSFEICGYEIYGIWFFIGF